MDLNNKTVIITGGSRGIGFATAGLFVRENSTVIILATDRNQLTTAQDELQKITDKIYSYEIDITDRSSIKELTKKIITEQKTIDILINNAGILNQEYFLDLEPAEWEREVDVNVKGMLNMTAIIAPHMVRQKDGIIINIASGAGKTGYAGLAVYSATKFAVLGFTEGFAKEVIDQNIRVYAVSPGTTQTRMTGFQGMVPEKVATVILKVAKETANIKPGQDAEIYS